MSERQAMLLVFLCWPILAAFYADTLVCQVRLWGFKGQGPAWRWATMVYVLLVTVVALIIGLTIGYNGWRPIK